MLKAFAENRAIVLATSLASSSEYAVSAAEPNIEFLHHLTKNALKTEEIVYAVIYNSEGTSLISQTRTNENIEKYVKSTPIESSLIKDLEQSRLQEDIISISEIGKVMDIMVPIIYTDFSTGIKLDKQKKEIMLGVVRTGLSLNEINNQKNRMIKSASLLTLFILFIGIIFSFFFIKVITKDEFSLGTKK